MRSIFVLLTTAILLLSLPLVFGVPVTRQVSETISQTFKSTVQIARSPSPTPIDAPSLTDIINTLRRNYGLKTLPLGQKTCLMANSALNNQQIDHTVVAQKCPECQSVQIARFSQPLIPNWFENQIATNASISAYFLSPHLTHMCVATDSAEAVVVLVTARSLAQVTPPPLTVNNFTEDQLWNALQTYRRSQGRSDLQKDENICRYARKRVQDHLDLLSKHLDAAAYPVPEKYPLDGHQGFKNDGDSGLLFEITQKTQLAENLAYWPNAQDPIHVIEWGWDSSTEGHREAQLSNDWTSACIAEQNGFYVAIFGK